MNDGLISAAQWGKMLYLFALGSAALLIPSAVISIAKQDAWLSMLLTVPFNYLVIVLYFALASRFPSLSLVQILEKVLGRAGGKLVAVSYIFFYLLLSALVLRNITDFLGSSVLPMTPPWFIAVTFMSVIVYGVMLGVETIARTGEILFVWAVLVIGFISILLLNQFQLKNFEPLLYTGIMTPIKGIYPVLGFPIGEFVFMAMLLQLIKPEERSKLKRTAKLSVLIIGISSVLIAILLIGVLGADLVVRSPFSVYDMAKQINIEEILVRVEILVAVVWVSTVFMKLILCFYVLTLSTAHLLHLSSYRALVVPYAFIVCPLAGYVYRNAAHARWFQTEVWTVYSVGMGFIIPLAVLILAKLRGLKELPGDKPKGSPPPVDTGESAKTTPS